MNKVLEKIVELPYDELLTLGVIEKNSDLTEVFRTEINMPFKILYKLQKEGKLNNVTKELLQVIFEKLILTKKSFIEQYVKLGNLEISQDKVTHVEPEVKIEEKFLEPIELDIKTSGNASSKSKNVDEKKIPRRYGKQQIEKDIIRQGFKATPLQRAGLRLNDLKNINVSLMNKFIKETHLGTETLSERDCLAIISSINTLEQKLSNILRKKL